MPRYRLLLIGIALNVASTAAMAENWPSWRGPHGNGHSGETGIATEWSRETNVAWRAELPGPGGASPVVWDDRIYVTSADSEADGANLLLLCFSTDGKELWRQTVAPGGNRNARSAEGNSASPSPVTDGQHVWCFFGNGILACYDKAGKEAWKFDLQDRYGKFDIQFGMTSTPVLDDGALYMQLIHGTWGGDYIVGKVIKLDAKTGDEIWAVDRPTGAQDECKHSYASAIMYDDGDNKFLLTHGADYTIAYDLDTGRELARLGSLNGPSKLNDDQYDNTFRLVATPSFGSGVVYVPTCKGGPMLAVNVADDIIGNVVDNPRAVRWSYDKSPDVSIPLEVDGRLFGVMKPGQVFILDAKTGKELDFQRIHSAEHRASPIYADGHLYICARDGVTTVLKAGPTVEVVAENDLGNEPITATPAIADGTLYIRTYDALYAIRAK